MDYDDDFDGVLISIIAVVAAALLAGIIGLGAKSLVRNEAIKRGHAHYEVNDKCVTSFVWNSEPPKKKSEKVEKCSCNH